MTGLGPARAGGALMAATLLAVSGCSDASPPSPRAAETQLPPELAQAPAEPPVTAEDAPGTPMAERVATIGVLNKRNNLSQDLEMRPGETRRIGDLVVRLSACERTAPWEVPPETGAFVQVQVAERRGGGAESWRQIFSGWLFKNSPSLNVVEHPIYDVWVKNCAMSFPGDEAPAGTAPAASPSPAPSPTRSPAPTA